MSSLYKNVVDNMEYITQMTMDSSNTRKIDLATFVCKLFDKRVSWCCTPGSIRYLHNNGMLDMQITLDGTTWITL